MSGLLARVTAEMIDEDALVRAVEAASCGAVVVFRGVVRDHDGGQAVRSLDYRAHPAAEEMLTACCDEVATSSGLRVAAAHRVGHLEIGDVALVAAVSAPHRGEAFEACALLVERIKESVPIWKRQHLQDGTTHWVGL